MYLLRYHIAQSNQKIMQFGWYGIAFILFSLSNAKMFMLQMHTILLQKFSETVFEWVEAGLTSFV